MSEPKVLDLMQVLKESLARDTGATSADQLLTPQEVAAKLRMSPRTIARLGIPCVHVGTGRQRPRRRYRSEDVEAYIRTRREAAR